jgi:arylsulfatase A-like enzyme
MFAMKGRNTVLGTLRTAMAGLCAFAAPGTLLAQAPTDVPPPVKPNILFIMADDLGKEWISAYGADLIQTPHIDALAAGGMKFQNAYAMPQCTPSRVSLLTGKYPFRTGWVNHWDVPRWGVGSFDWRFRENTTVATLLREQGYATAAAGKWQINDFRLQPMAMEHHGFDDWAMWTGYETGVPASGRRYWNPYINTREGSATRRGAFGEDVFADFLIDFMRRHRDQPMFLYYPMVLPHIPLVGTPDNREAATRMDKHKAMVRYMDTIVGRLVAALDELHLRERTIIIFTTDNGSTTSITGSQRGREVRGAKQRETESGVSMPFIVNAPGLVPAGVVTDALTDFTDLLPTFVDLAGGVAPSDLTIDGVSIAPLLLGRAEDSSREWILSMGRGPARLDEQGIRGADDFGPRVIRDKRYKVWVNTDKVIDQLYDMLQDPWEEHNLIDSDKPEHRTALAKFQAIVDAMPDEDARPLYTPQPPNPWDRTLNAADPMTMDE